jgi:F420-non-reducing hydrogenase iron-sulfur subunit
MSAVTEIDSETASGIVGVEAPHVSVFVCANCARPGKKSTSAGRTRPTLPDFGWPFPVEQIVVPCAGRIQPEHVLKTFESGDDVVMIVACDGDNCHYIEGSTRCTRRVEFIRSILEEIGLGEERLQLSFLPGSAAEDMLATAGKKTTDSEPSDARVVSVREQTIHALEMLSTNPLRLIDAAQAIGSDTRERLDARDDSTDK